MNIQIITNVIKSIFAFSLIFVYIPFAAMGQQTITLIGDGNAETYVVQEALALQIPLVARIAQSDMKESGKSIIHLPSVPSEHLKLVVDLLNTNKMNPTVTNKTLMDQFESACPLDCQQALDVMHSAHYLEYKPLLAYAAYQLVKQAKDEIPEIIAELCKTSFNIEEIIHEIRRFFYLVHSEVISLENAPDAPCYFSIQELLDHGLAPKTIRNQFRTENNYRLKLCVDNLEGLKQLIDGLDTRVERLNFCDGHRISSINPSQFACCPALEVLDLWDTTLETLPSDAFQGLNSLWYLRIANSPRLKTLPSKLFHPLTALIKLDLAQNNLSSLDPRSLTGLTNLTTLNLRCNPLRSLPERLFESCTQLQELDLTACKLRFLPPRLLAPLTRLEELELRANELSSESFSSDFFQNNRCLQQLDLGDNQLTVLSDKQFAALHALKRLDLTHNSLKTVPENAFGNCTELHSLFMENTGLSQLPPALFKKLAKLQYLGLEKNHIKQLDTALFLPLKALEIVSLRGNPLENLEASALAALPKLRTLELRKTNISKDRKAQLQKELPLVAIL